MTTIVQEANKLNPDTYVEFFDFDATKIGGTTSYYTNTPTGSFTHIIWRGQPYSPLPLIVTGYETRADGSAPNRPTISISNANKFLMAAVLLYGDLIGTKVVRWRTFYKFTDNGEEANPNVYFPVDEYLITRKLPSSFKTELKYEMTNALDRPGLRLPRRQVLRDLGFPGVSRVRVR